MTKTKSFDQDGIFEIPRKLIHPDPDQPRVKVDDGLQASIDSEGIIQAITVRPHPELADEWMIVDGERRYLGGAHLKTIPCRIRLDLEDSVDRLITQLAANAGKPLTPIEEARAFKKALDADPKLTQAKLAERLGIPRSTIGDRIRLIEIHPAWMKLIESGKLQVSHAPLIHQYRAVPDDYQVKAAKNVADGEGWQMQKYSEKGDIIPIAAFRDILRDAFKDYVIRLDEVRSYKGPVLEIEEESYGSFYGSGTKLKKVKYASDVTIWRPIKREAEKRAKKARESSPSSYSGGYQSPMTIALKALKAAGIDVPVAGRSRTRSARLSAIPRSKSRRQWFRWRRRARSNRSAKLARPASRSAIQSRAKNNVTAGEDAFGI
jgi:ParB/RepB/Spo0J family partition protein